MKIHHIIHYVWENEESEEENAFREPEREPGLSGELELD